jgi:hypothetical protein
MFYTTGEQYCYDLLYTVAREFFPKRTTDLGIADFQRASRRWAEKMQPWIRGSRGLAVSFCNDQEVEENLLAALHEPSPLDDLAHYAQPAAFKRSSPDRARITAEVAHAERAVRAFRKRDEPFWEIFEVYVRYVICVDSKYSMGGTNSNALGVVYLVAPSRLTSNELYELFVHETTHLAMFVDQSRQRHYRDFAAIADPANFCVSAVYERQRPLDKVLHSLVVATEVLLHREKTLGHDAGNSVHPGTPKLAMSALTTAEALLALQSRKQLLAPRGVWLVERCRELLAPFATRNIPARRVA